MLKHFFYIVQVVTLYPRGEWADAVPYAVPEPEDWNGLFNTNQPGFLKPFKWHEHDIRFSPRLELTRAKITNVTPRLELPVRSFNYLDGDRIIVYIGGSFSCHLTPVSPANSVFLYYEHGRRQMVNDTKEVVDASHLVEKNPRRGRTHVFYVACYNGAFAFGPEEAMMSTPAFMEKVSN